MSSSRPPVGRGAPRQPAPGVFFAAVNGSLLALQLLAAVAAQSFLGTRVIGDTTVGVLLLAVQGVVLLLTAVRYEHVAGAGLAAEEAA